MITPDFVGEEEEPAIKIKQIGATEYRVTGQLVQEIVAKTEFNNEAAVNRLLRILRHHELNEKNESNRVTGRGYCENWSHGIHLPPMSRAVSVLSSV